MLVLYIVIARTLAKISIKKIPPLQVKLQFLQESSQRGRGRGGNNYRTRSRFKRLDDDLCRKNHNKNTHTHKLVFLLICISYLYTFYVYFVINCCYFCCISVNFPPLFACRLCWLHRTRSLLPRNCDGIGDRPRDN